MAISLAGLTSLARSADLRIEALNTPTAPGQPQEFQIRPASLQFIPTPSTLPLPNAASLLNGLIPTEAVLNAASAVRIEVVWGVEDREGNPLLQEEAIVCSRGTDTAADLARSLQATVMVLPDFVELVKDAAAPPIKTRYVTASVTLSVGSGDKDKESVKLPLLRYPITIPAIPIPTLAIFFAKPNLGVDENGELQSGDQFALIVVPENSPIGDLPALRALLDTLAELSRTVDNIKTLAGLAGNVLPAIDQLAESAGTLARALNVHMVGSEVGVAFVAADRIPNLNDIDTIKRGTFSNDIEAEDTISSIVLLGPPGRRLRCFRHRDYSGRALIVATGGACIAIVNEMTNTPVAVLPPAIAGLAPPRTVQTNEGLDNRMSSLAFV